MSFRLSVANGEICLWTRLPAVARNDKRIKRTNMCKCSKYTDDKLHHECGVLGIYGVPDAAGLAYYGLHTLQHRGQQGCGIVTVGPEGEFHP